MAKNFRDAYDIPQKRQIRWTLIILVLFFLGLLVDYLFLHLVFKEKEAAMAGSTVDGTGTNGADTVVQVPPPPPSENPQASPTVSTGTSSPAMIEKFQKEIVKCFGAESPYAKMSSADELVKQILETHPAQKSQFEVENTHVRLNDGSVRRLHLIQSDASGGKNTRELRYYSLDAEGLPVLIPLPDKDRLNPSEAFIDSLKKEGTVIYHQVKENRTLKDGSSISLDTINNSIYEFQLFSKEMTFSCREIICQCRL